MADTTKNTEHVNAQATDAVNDAAARAQAFWQQRADQQIAALDAAVEQMSALQSKGREQMLSTVDQVTSEMNRLFKAQLDYMTEMQSQFQAMTLETIRRTTNLGG